MHSILGLPSGFLARSPRRPDEKNPSMGLNILSMAPLLCEVPTHPLTHPYLQLPATSRRCPKQGLTTFLTAFLSSDLNHRHSMPSGTMSFGTMPCSCICPSTLQEAVAHLLERWGHAAKMEHTHAANSLQRALARIAGARMIVEAASARWSRAP